MPNQALEQTRDSILRYGEVVGCELLNFFVRQQEAQSQSRVGTPFGFKIVSLATVLRRDLLIRAGLAVIYATAVIVAPYVIEGAVAWWDDDYRIRATDSSMLAVLCELIACFWFAMMMLRPLSAPVIHGPQLPRRQSLRHRAWSLLTLWWQIACVRIAYRVVQIALFVVTHVSENAPSRADVQAYLWVSYASTLALPLAFLWPVWFLSRGVSDDVRCSGRKWVVLTLSVSFANVTLLLIWLTAILAKW